MVITNYLNPKNNSTKRQKCFVGYSYHAQWSDDIKRACKDILAPYNLDPWYAEDEFDPTRSPIDKVVEMTKYAQFGIYDLSFYKNKDGRWCLPRNVLIEFGIAISLNLPIILIRHSSNNNLKLPDPIAGLDIIEFSGWTTLKTALEKRLPDLINVPRNSNNWFDPVCKFGNRKCDYRELHPRSTKLYPNKLFCLLSDGIEKSDADRSRLEKEELKEVFCRILQASDEEVKAINIDNITLAEGYQFLLCSFCQAIRFSPFGIQRITEKSSVDTFITIGMWIGLENIINYKIPTSILVNQQVNLPSLLLKYEVIEISSTSVLEHRLRSFIPKVIYYAKETIINQRELPYDVFEIGDKLTEKNEDYRIRELVERPVDPPANLFSFEDDKETYHMLTIILRSTGDKTRDVIRFRRIHGVITSYPGKDRFAFHVFERGRGYLLEFPNNAAGICPEMISRLISLVGEDNVRIDRISFQ